ncbi:hypothetical protein Hanom_Chr04g00385531 [Helianthus anomalus]
MLLNLFRINKRAEMEESRRSINPWMLRLQKLALELKCPLWFLSFASFPVKLMHF